MSCPDDNAFTEFLACALDGAARDEIEQHIDQCDACRAVLVGIARCAPPDETCAKPAPPAGPERRYVPMRVLGTGGMGIVYAARDEHLHRDVALKVMLDAPQDVRARLAAEACVLAKLSHPNVVEVFDVDLSDGNAFVVMALVGGADLRTWLSARPRPWRQIVDVLLDAARGLQAAHALGIAHGDVSPSNILVTHDGHALVSDFGLARASLGDTTRIHAATGTRHRGSDTQPLGAGTPGYVAPEVDEGGPASPAADQFAFCVVAREALSHASDRIPRAVRRVLGRGLRPAPPRRHASMTALSEALVGATSPRRPVAILTALCVGLALVSTLSLARQKASPLPCGLSSPDIGTGAAAFDAALAVHAQRWESVRDESCRARNAATLTQAAFDLRWECLRRSREAVQVLAGRIREAAVQGGPRSGAALSGLDAAVPPERCAEDALLAQRIVLPPPALRPQIDTLRRALADADAQLLLGQSAPARRAVAALEPQVRRVGHEPLLADLLLLRGRIEREAGQHDQARETLGRAAALASASNLDEVAAYAWVQSLWLEGYQRMDLQGALQAQRVLDAYVHRLGDPPWLVGLGAQAMGATYDRLGDHERAQPFLAQAARIAVETAGPDSARFAEALTAQGANQARRGAIQEGRASLTSAHRIYVALGAGGTTLEAMALGNLAGLEINAHRPAVAAPLAERALAVFQAVGEVDHPRVAWLHARLGEAFLFDDQPARALPHLHEAAVRYEHRLGPEHPDSLYARYQHAQGFAQLGRDEQAYAIIKPAHAYLEGDGVSPTLRGVVLALHGQLAANTQRLGEARRLCGCALAVLEGLPVPETLAGVRDCLAEVDGH